jgi:biotin carboxyl carrier protein
LFERTFESAAESAVIRTEELAVSEPETLTVKTSATGIFRQTHPLAASTQSDAPSVRYGQHIGYLEIDSVFCPISAPADGVLKTILPQDGKHVGYGQPVAEIHIDRSEQRGNGRA